MMLRRLPLSSHCRCFQDWIPTVSKTHSNEEEGSVCVCLAGADLRQQSHSYWVIQPNAASLVLLGGSLLHLLVLNNFLNYKCKEFQMKTD